MQITVERAEPPPAIALEARPGYRGIRLAWAPMRAVHVTAYRILRVPTGEDPQTEIGRIRKTHYLDTSDALTPETRYCYRIEAVCADAAVLGRSNLACAV